MRKDDSYFKTRLGYEPKRDKIWKPIVRYLERWIPENPKVLELGAGYCSFINQVTAAERHALDRSDIITRYAGDDVRTYVRDCSRLDCFADGYFDLVFSSFLFEHLTRRKLDDVMRELRRILRRDGILMTLLPNFKYVARHYFDDYTHIQIFSHLSFADYVESHGFIVTEVQGRFLPFSFKSRFPKSAVLTAIYLRLPWRPFAGNMLVIARNPDVRKKVIRKPPAKRSGGSQPENRRTPQPENRRTSRPRRRKNTRSTQTPRQTEKR